DPEHDADPGPDAVPRRRRAVNHFIRRRGELFCEEVPLARIARRVGTPTYVYSAATLRRHARVFHGALRGLDFLACYAVKAAGNLALLALLAKEGYGFDIVSGGELHRALRAGAAFRAAAALRGLEVIGLACHIGSQIGEVKPFVEAALKLRSLFERLRAEGHPLRHLDVGGGLGVPYGDGPAPPSPQEYGKAL